MDRDTGQQEFADDASIKRILQNMQQIVVVGISDKEDRASHGIAKFLIGQGFEVIGVNPTLSEVLGVPVYSSLADVPGELDLVDIFRKSEAVGPIVQEAIVKGAKTIWMQEGVVNTEAAATAAAAGLDVVMDRCIYKEWLRLMNT